MFYCGHSSVVERLVANEKVEGSTPFARSIKLMNDLLKKKCVPCEGGVIPFDIVKFTNIKKKSTAGIYYKMIKILFFLEKNFKFKTFLESHNFVNKLENIRRRRTSSRYCFWLGLCKNKYYNTCY